MKHLRDPFYQRSDRIAAIALIAVAGVCAAIMLWVGRDTGNTVSAVRTDTVYVRSKSSGVKHPGRQYVGQVEERRAELFVFDPNTADSTALLRLGLQPWQVRNIYKYRARGGVYRSPDDFARLYGLTAGQFRRLRPYIRISSDFLPAATLVEQRPVRRDTLRYPVKLKQGEHVDLNSSDTAVLRRVPGIGSYYARAILRYGARLGGYVSIDQLDEIEGFPADAKPYFTVGAVNTRRINLNTQPLSVLRRHPYINFYQAKAIIDYRRQHGRINSLADLKLSRDFPPEAISRLQPYVEF